MTPELTIREVFYEHLGFEPHGRSFVVTLTEEAAA